MFDDVRHRLDGQIAEARDRESDECDRIFIRTIRSRGFFGNDQTRGRICCRHERALPIEIVFEVCAKFRARPNAGVDRFVANERELRTDGQRCIRRGRRSHHGGVERQERRRAKRDDAEGFYDAFFSASLAAASAAKAASAAAFLPCSIKALTFWPPFWPISS